jgi:ubiquinone/menaquinone biosynthesis C-methylase UbiE
MPEHQFKDHFSRVASQYAAFRPHYPQALFDYLADVAPSRTVAWDCACGSGQATLDLAERFASVMATDASAQQIAAAPVHPRITWSVARAESSGLPPDSVDLITVAQSAHWFDLDAFYAEARRVLRPNGVLALWTYGVHRFNDAAMDALAHELYAETVGPYWPPERRHCEDGYRSLPFAFPEIVPPAFEMKERWTLPQLLGYLRSWSATSRYVQAHGNDPIVPFGEAIAPMWGEGERVVEWPLGLRIGRNPPAGA